MARVTIVTSNQKKIGLHPIYHPDQINTVIETIREQLHELLDKDIAQDDYNKRYKISENDLEHAFNEDMLYIAIGMRGYGDEYENVATDIGIDVIDVQAIEAGLVIPSKVHVKLMSKGFNFPYGFFTREGKADRNHEFTWSCHPSPYLRYING